MQMNPYLFFDGQCEEAFFTPASILAASCWSRCARRLSLPRRP